MVLVIGGGIGGLTLALSLHQAGIGVIVAGRTVHDLSEAFATCNVVVNCAGLGARELAHDKNFRPTRGQVVRVQGDGDDAGGAPCPPRCHR